MSRNVQKKGVSKGRTFRYLKVSSDGPRKFAQAALPVEEPIREWKVKEEPQSTLVGDGNDGHEVRGLVYTRIVMLTR